MELRDLYDVNRNLTGEISKKPTSTTRKILHHRNGIYFNHRIVNYFFKKDINNLIILIFLIIYIVNIIMVDNH